MLQSFHPFKASEGPGESPIDRDVECQGVHAICVRISLKSQGGSLEIAETVSNPKQDQGIKDKSGMRRDKTWKSQATSERMNQ
ncbi:Uncharacterized protein HZ326_3242 [Fusarium oxysporum f. sp. albedinis]|nr:Uncharacterized protein HZ326_3242 [Fusarium oxysporum f. sp. albedinis]